MLFIDDDIFRIVRRLLIILPSKISFRRTVCVNQLEGQDNHKNHTSKSKSTALFASRLIHLSLRGDLVAELSSHLSLLYNLLLSLGIYAFSRREIGRLGFSLINGSS